jgi:indolepyruvate ferredoxin oxidoreductase beta subunit
MAMLGAASAVLPLEVKTLEAVIERVVPPKTVEANLRAFRLGRDG